jgi:hypothetical protein
MSAIWAAPVGLALEQARLVEGVAPARRVEAAASDSPVGWPLAAVRAAAHHR